MILEEPPALSEETCASTNAYVFTLSAKTCASLEKSRIVYVDFLAAGPAERLEDICFTSCMGRFSYPERLAVVASSIPELCRKLRGKGIKASIPGTENPYVHAVDKAKHGLFIFDHIGCLGGMDPFIYENQPHFKEALDGFDDLLKVYEKPKLSSFFYGPEKHQRDKADVLAYAFCLQYALHHMLSRFGISPRVVCSHGAGILAAACAAGVFRKEDGLKMAFLIEEVLKASSELRPKCVSSLKEWLGVIDQRKSSIAIYSEEYGRILEVSDFCDSEFWVRSCCEPGKDAAGSSCFQNGEPCDFTVRMGGHGSWQEQGHGIPSLKLSTLDRTEWESTLSFFCESYERGFDIRWDALMKGCRGQRVSLPTYCFNKTSCWYTE